MGLCLAGWAKTCHPENPPFANSPKQPAFHASTGWLTWGAEGKGRDRKKFVIKSEKNKKKDETFCFYS